MRIRRVPRRMLVGLPLLAAAAIGAIALVLSSGREAQANPLDGIADIDISEGATCLLMESGSVMCAGERYGSLAVEMPGLPTNIQEVSAGANRICARDETNMAWCWDPGPFPPTPTLLTAFGDDLEQLAIGQDSCAITTAGVVRCIYFNRDSSQYESFEFSLYAAAIQLSVGDGHWCALIVGGSVACGGDNNFGQSGTGSPIPDLDAPAISVTAASSISCAALTTGRVQCWGYGYGLSPEFVPGVFDAVSVSGSGRSFCAITTSAGLKCWGANHYGQLGDGLACGAFCPQPVVPEGLESGVGHVAADHHHTCAVLVDGTARCWGQNFWGNLGDGTMTNRFTPSDVVVSEAKPVPTATSCLPGSCPTPTPTQPGPPLSGIDWSLAVDVDGDGHLDCGTGAGTSTSCYALQSDEVTLRLELHSLSPQTETYSGFDAFFYLLGDLTASDEVTFIWPDCYFAARDYHVTASGEKEYALACATFDGSSASSYVGPMAMVGIHCEATGMLSLRHGLGRTAIAYDDPETNEARYAYEADPGEESLTIFCLEPGGDEDGDGCSNGLELSGAVNQGGQRNPGNPWDFFDTTGDRRVRVADIVRVVRNFNIDAGDPRYTPETDRTRMGPLAWHLGPPDGRHRTEDIAAVVGQFGHDCA